jgi:hypothetical protein
MNVKRLATLTGAASMAVIAATTLLLAQGSAGQKAQIHIYWGKSSWLNWACSKGAIKVVLDDKEIGEIEQKECVKTAIQPGNHVLLGLKQAMVKRQDLRFEAFPARNVYIKGDCATDDRIWRWNLQTEDQAKDWVDECKPVEAKEEKK